MVTTVEMPSAPTLTRPRGTLLSTVTPDDSKFTWNDGRDLFESYNCLNFDAEATFCGPNTKDLSGTGGWVDGVRFAAYGGVTCKAVGLDREGMEAGLRQAFEMGESTAVERALMKYRFAANPDNTTDLPGAWDAPIDITPDSGVVKPAVGVALLEEAAGSMYAGQPTLHLTRGVASMLLGVDGATFEGDALRTKFGSKVAAGAGYSLPNLGPDGTASTGTGRWIYATGEVWVARGPITFQSALEQSNNEVVALAERGYIAAVDCFAIAIRVDLSL